MMIPLRLATPSRDCLVIQACLVLHNFAITSRDLYEPLLPGEETFQEEIAILRRRLSRNPDVNHNRAVQPATNHVSLSNDGNEGEQEVAYLNENDVTEEVAEQRRIQQLDGKRFRDHIATTFF